jgi:2-polyprenyl-6-methoxyphenol hydroxylase-like FAD-dependent oxidoreductase
VDDSLAAAIAEHAHNLQTLLAEFCPQFAVDPAMATLAAGNCRLLRQLGLGDGRLTDIGIESLIRATFKDTVKTVDVRRNNDVTQNGYNLLAQNLALEEIDGVALETIIDGDVGSYFMLKRSMMGEG